MTKKDYLNLASDLRRAAYFAATEADNRLLDRLLDEIGKNKEVKRNLKINFSLKNKLLAEELLMASRQVMISQN